MTEHVNIIGGGLAGSEAALQLAQRGISVRLYEMRPSIQTPVHSSGNLAELVCSNSLKSLKPESAAGMLKYEMQALGSLVLEKALEHRVAAGGALAVNRDSFSQSITELVRQNPLIECIEKEIVEIPSDHITIVATGPMTSDRLAGSLRQATGKQYFAFYDAAAPIVMADSLDYEVLFRQSRYEDGEGDYLNAPFTKEEYSHFIGELIQAKKVIRKNFETKDLFQACQPIEEIARKGTDAPRFGPLKPVGLRDPRTESRPWAALQLRAENEYKSSYNLVGFQTNLTFGEQERVFRLIPGLEHAEFVRYGVMHKNTFIDAPHLLDAHFRLQSLRDSNHNDTDLFVAGQLAGTEGYCEAIMSGLYVALSVYAAIKDIDMAPLPKYSAAGSLFAYATDDKTEQYQPMHVNFGLMEPLKNPIKNKKARYAAYAERGQVAIDTYCDILKAQGIL